MVTEVPTPVIKSAEVQLLERLCNASGISGDEGEVRKIVLETVKSFVDEINIDAIGNILVSRKSPQKGKHLRVMLAAHMDEVGLMIVQDEGEGIYKFETVGGISTSQLIGKSVVIGKKQIPGVIGSKPVHHVTAKERKSQISKDSLRIDTGPGNPQKVNLGDRAAFTPNFLQIGKGPERVLQSKALDNRLGVATLLLLLKNAPPNIDLLGAFTVQEEIGLRGAKIAAQALNPDIAIALDCTPAKDLPHWDEDDENSSYNTRLGAGPAIYIADKSTLSDPRLIRHFAQTGDTAGIPYQFRQPGGGGTDAGIIHKSLAGIPSISISVPGRYAHTAAGIARFSDWQNTLKLVFNGLATLSPDILNQDRR